jgi:hypothetical protein
MKGEGDLRVFIPRTAQQFEKFHSSFTQIENFATFPIALSDVYLYNVRNANSKPGRVFSVEPGDNKLV